MVSEVGSCHYGVWSRDLKFCCSSWCQHFPLLPVHHRSNNTGQWLACIQQFEDFFTSGLVSVLHVSPSLSYFGFSHDWHGRKLTPHVTQSIKKVIEYFVDLVNKIYESSGFHKCSQLPGETVHAFVIMLLNVVKKCSYPLTVEHHLIRDHFVLSLLNFHLSDELCRILKLTLQDALTQARFMMMLKRKNKLAIPKYILLT